MDPEKKRARSDIDKAMRRAAILSAGREAMLEEGYDAVTMAGLAKRAGLAKGTLYLYFQAKEDVFLWLYVELLEDLILRLEDAFSARIGDAEFVEQMVEALTEDPLLLPMTGRLTSVIEVNTSLDAMIGAKRMMLGQFLRLSAAVEQALGLAQGDGMRLTRAMQIALGGAAQVDLAMANLTDDYPEDVREMIEASSFAQTFPDTLSLLIRGARAG